MLSKKWHIILNLATLFIRGVSIHQVPNNCLIQKSREHLAVTVFKGCRTDLFPPLPLPCLTNWTQSKLSDCLGEPVSYKLLQPNEREKFSKLKTTF